ncbi:MAG: NUDIX domain-containing protein [Actinomycetota bacterium]
MTDHNAAEPERLDIVTATGAPLGDATRAEVHRDGRWHNVFHCLVIRSGRPARVVLQRRHRSKAAFPGLLDLSATGHLIAGERPIDGVRELNEELGTSASPGDLTPIGVRLLADDGGEGRNRERVHLYFLADDRSLADFGPDPAEVESLVEVEVADLLRLLAADQVDEEDADTAASSVSAVEWRPGSAERPTTIRQTDLVPAIDGYWVVVLVMAERFVAGDRPLAI